jgi:hypothetical protein
MLRRGFSATTTWTAVMAVAVRTICLLLLLGNGISSWPSSNSFDLENQAPSDPQVLANLGVVLAPEELLTDELVAGMIHGH